MKVSNVSQMQLLDRMTIEETGIEGIMLMENASKAVFDVCKGYLNSICGKHAVIVCGVGNNGGDGFAIGRMLKNIDIQTKILFLGDKEKLKEDAYANYELAFNMGIEIEKNFVENFFNDADIIIDAIFGTGFKGELRQLESSVIKAINESKKYVVSVDLPSGVNGDTGEVSSICIKANETVTFQLPKIGILLYPASDYCGKITTADISIPKENIDKINFKINVLTKQEASSFLPKRENRSNKGTFGKVVLLAGSAEMTGAGVFSAKSAYKSGCGLVYANMPEECRTVMNVLVPEAIFKTVDSKYGKFSTESIKSIYGLEEAGAVILGPGIGGGEEVSKFVEGVLREVKSPIVIDADGLNAIAKNKKILKSEKTKTIVTPHIKEMSRLTGLSVAEILKDTINVAKDFAKENNVVVLLKDARTIIANPDGDIYINTTGNNSMAKGGSGDVLSGVIGALLAQGMPIFEGAVLGCWLHGVAGDLAAKEFGHYGVMASELADYISYAIKEIEQ